MKWIWNSCQSKFGTTHHLPDLGKLEFGEYKPLSLYAHTPINACKFQAEFVIVIVIDSKKISDFNTMHTIFEFHGLDLSLEFFHSFIQLRS